MNIHIHGHRLSTSAAAGLCIVAINLLAALLGPVLAPYGEADVIGDVWDAPNGAAWLGLDNLGRDMFSRLMFGARTTICIALLVTLLSFAVGICLGLGAAIRGGWVDTLLSRLVDAIMAVPAFIVCLIVLAVIGTSTPVLVGTIALLDSTKIFRLSRSVGVNVAAMEYTEVARLRGESTWWVTWHEILPNVLPPLLAEFGLRFCFAVLFVASLSFLGLGVQPPDADWGGMVRDNAAAINFGGLAPVIPAMAIAQLTIGVNLVVDWIVDLREDVQEAEA